MSTRGGGPVQRTPLRQKSWSEPGKMPRYTLRDSGPATRNLQDPPVESQRGNLESMNGPSAWRVCVQDNAPGSRNRAAVERDVRQGTPWLPLWRCALLL